MKSDLHALHPAPSSGEPISALDLARLAAQLPGADQEPRLAVRRALALLHAAEECLAEAREEADLTALAQAQDDADFLPLDEAMMRTSHKKPGGFYKRAQELCSSYLDRAWLGDPPDAEGFDPATTRVHIAVVKTILAAERQAAARQKKRRRGTAE